MIPKPKIVFFDPSGRRWTRLRLVAFILMVIGFVGLVLFVQSILISPKLRLPSSIAHMRSQMQAYLDMEGHVDKSKLWKDYKKNKQQAVPKETSKADSSKFIRMAFVSDWDRDSVNSFTRNAKNLTHICPESISVSDGMGKLDFEEDTITRDLAKANNVVLMPLLNNLSGDTWRPEAIENLAMSKDGRKERFFETLTTHLKSIGAGGVVVDFQRVDPNYKAAFTSFISEMARSLHQNNLELWLCVSVGQDLKVLELDTLSQQVDRFIALLHDENAEKGEVGPVASQDWFEGWMGALLAYGRPDQWIISIGAYGYDWNVTQKQVDTISFSDAMVRAEVAKVKSLRSDGPTYNPRFSYYDGHDKHRVWFLDAITFLNQMRAAYQSDVGGIAVNRLGTEDPDIWLALSYYNKPMLNSEMLKTFSYLKGDSLIGGNGEGEFLTVDLTNRDGHRNLTVVERELIIAEYVEFPQYPTLYHQGKGDEHEVALTFDDGPDPKWTPKILDILKKYHVKAAFFVLGVQAEKYPELVERIISEGHEIGNHTFFHPDLSSITRKHAILELNANQRLIESITGHSTILFRPPYIADSKPNTYAELEAISVAQDLGYITVAQEIDPRDYELPGTDELLQRVKEQRHLGNIVLMHDGGGDRTQTVEALPRILNYLQMRGDQIVPLAQLLGYDRDSLMPPVKIEGRNAIASLSSSVGFRFLHALEEFFWSLMIVTTVIILIRTLVIACLAALHVRKANRARFSADFAPSVTVIVAAYNEEKVISKTIESLLASSYWGKLEVVVINDGSQDATASVVEGIVPADSRVRLINQPNSGKAVALQNALKEAQGEIVVMIDADTCVAKRGIQNLVKHFIDPEVVAVSGRAHVGNLCSWITHCQSLEYTCGFNLDRRAYDVLNCITVVPGAIGAYRRDIVKSIGITSDTLAEDTDLTLNLHRRGGKIAYAEDAYAYTEAPETIRGLAKQRFRWAFGTMQCLWKHRDLVFSPTLRALGFFSLPSVWVFQIGLVALMPIVDLLLIFSLIARQGDLVAIYFMLFLLVDVGLAFLACWLDGEKLYRAVWILPMRFVYRPLLAYVVWKSILLAIRGAIVGWARVERTASVELKEPDLESKG